MSTAAKKHRPAEGGAGSPPVQHSGERGHDGRVGPATASGARYRHVTARIYKPSPSVLQAGRANTRRWLLEFEPTAAPRIEPLMGWTSSADPLQQVRLSFPTREQAVAFAERQGWTCVVIEPQERQIRPKSYADNFRAWPPRPRLRALPGGR